MLVKRESARPASSDIFFTFPGPHSADAVSRQQPVHTQFTHSRTTSVSDGWCLSTPDRLITADADSWWAGLLGPGKPLDTDKYMVFCANVLGSCYGTCGPTTVDPKKGIPYGGDFPLVTVRDSVEV